MSKVIAGMIMSLDGLVQDREGSVTALYPDFDQADWLQHADAHLPNRPQIDPTNPFVREQVG